VTCILENINPYVSTHGPTNAKINQIDLKLLLKRNFGKKYLLPSMMEIIFLVGCKTMLKSLRHGVQHQIEANAT
jgi:hypothetical protein